MIPALILSTGRRAPFEFISKAMNSPAPDERKHCTCASPWPPVRWGVSCSRSLHTSHLGRQNRRQPTSHAANVIGDADDHWAVADGQDLCAGRGGGGSYRTQNVARFSYPVNGRLETPWGIHRMGFRPTRPPCLDSRLASVLPHPPRSCERKMRGPAGRSSGETGRERDAGRRC